MLSYDKDRFKIELPYPHKSDYDTFYVYQRGKVLIDGGNVNDLINFANTCQNETIDKDFKSRQGAIEYLKNAGYSIESVNNGDAYKAARTEYNRQLNEKDIAWRKELSEHYGLDIINDPVGQILIAHAWEDGHSSGYQEVDNCLDGYITLLDDILKVINASKYCLTNMTK